MHILQNPTLIEEIQENCIASCLKKNYLLCYQLTFIGSLSAGCYYFPGCRYAFIRFSDLKSLVHLGS